MKAKGKRASRSPGRARPSTAKRSTAAPLDALHGACSAWRRRTLDGDALALAVSEVLFALTAAAESGDLAALNAKGGPVKWAIEYERAHPWLTVDVSTRRPMPEGLRRTRPDAARADAARAFVSWCDALRTKRDPARVGLALAKGAARVAGLAAFYLVRDGVRYGLVPSPTRPLEELEREMHQALLTLRGRDPDAKAIAVALLRPWMQSNEPKRQHAQARDRVRGI